MENEKRIAALEDDNAVITDRLTDLLAGFGVMRQMLSTLIAAHPRPAALRSAWHGRRLDRVDNEMEQPFFAIPGYRDAYLELLQQLSLEVDRAADAV